MTRLLASVSLVVALLAPAAADDVVINEIHYHPPEVPPDPAGDAEFIEIHNAGASVIDVSGWTLSGYAATPFAFPAATTINPGEYIVVAKDIVLLEIVTGGFSTPYQWPSGSLNNAGEAVILSDASSTVIDEVVYDDEAPWPTEADGTGPSLELLHPDFPNEFGSVWRPSVADHGTPGAQNDVFSSAPVVLTESPARGSLISSLPSVSVTFAEAVVGVTAGDLVVNASAATDVTGGGAGPYVFTGYAAPTDALVSVVLDSGSIRDLDSNGFGGDSWVYSFDVPNVVINEIHYHPPEVPPDPFGDAEFIELYNADAATVALANWSVGGFSSTPFVFPAGTDLAPGGYVVIAKNPAVLESVISVPGPLFQWPSGSLANSSEPVILWNATGIVVDDVTYSDESPWPTGPDGNGPSAELLYPDFPNEFGRSWRASSGNHGTPGAQNSVFSSNPVVVTESPARGSLIEFLTSVSVTFSESVTGVTAADLMVGGSAATLLSGSGAGPYEFTGFAEPSEGLVDVALGSGVIQDAESNGFAGDNWQYQLDLPVIVINELHYHPATSEVGAGEDPERLQFIELLNADTVTVDLSNWSITDGVDFIFPASTSMAPGEFLVVAKDAAFLQAAVTTIPAAVEVLQWTTGDLANGGERVAISGSLGNIVDELTYSDHGGWSRSADGQGPSLELTNPLLPNNFATAWQASVSTNGTPGEQNSVYQPDPAPAIGMTRHNPPIPLGNQAVTIVTTVIDDDVASPAVTLHYRLDQSPPVAYSSVAMVDDGLHGDGTAGDKVFGQIVAGLPDGERLDFFIEAVDVDLSASVAPPGHDVPDARGNPSQTFLCKFSNEVQLEDYPTYHLIITEENRADQEVCGPGRGTTGYDATFIDDAGNIFYNVIERYRGASSLQQNPASYRVDFNADEPLISELGFELTHLNMLAQQPVRQTLGFNLFEAAGLAASKIQFVRFKVNPTECTNPPINGHIYANAERIDEEFIARYDRFPAGTETGNVYRGRHDGAKFEWEGFDPDEYRVDEFERDGYQKITNEAADEWTDLINLCDAMWCSSSDGGLLCTEDTYDGVWPELIQSYADTDEWARWFAVHLVLNNREGGIYRDTGDDFFLFFYPTTLDHATLLAWDFDAILVNPQESIWRTTVPAVQRFLRHNAFAPIFVSNVVDFLDTEFSQAAMDPRIDAIPDNLFPTPIYPPNPTSPRTKQQFKDWVAARRAFIEAELVRDLTIEPLSDPYTGQQPLVALDGTLDQAGTFNVTVNGQQTSFSVFLGEWSHSYMLRQGVNNLIVQSFGRYGAQMDRVEQSVVYNPAPAQLRLTLPTRMIADKTMTIKAELLDVNGEIDWREWSRVGTVTATRLSDFSSVPVTITEFETDPEGVGGDVPPADSIRLYNGAGSVSFTLDDPEAQVGEVVRLTVVVGSLTASRPFKVLANEPVTFKELVGTLTGPDLTWGPEDGVIHLIGDVVVPAGDTLTILPDTLVMVDSGPPDAGTTIVVNGAVDARGTRSNPIALLPTEGPAAMALPLGQPNNPAAWRGIDHSGSGQSTYEHVFVTGAGNGAIESHQRPAVLRFTDSHSGVMSDCLLADAPGKLVQAGGSSTLTIKRCLFSRNGMGGDFFGPDHEVLLEDCRFNRIGRAALPDGDAIHLGGASAVQTVRGCIFADVDEDAIDHADSVPLVENCIIWNASSNGVRLAGGGLTSRNVLLFDAAGGISGDSIQAVSVSSCTIAADQPVDAISCAGSSVDQTILWPGSASTCCGNVNYTLVGDPGDLGCGAGNFSADPEYLDAPARDYQVPPLSPAYSAGPSGELIGWLGFPTPISCVDVDHCDDSDPCTTDLCAVGQCQHVIIPGCRPCADDGACDDGTFCNGAEFCGSNGTCQPAAAVVCGGQVCDETGDQCVDCLTDADCADSNLCNGEESCDAGVCVAGLPIDCSFLDSDCSVGVCSQLTGVCSLIPVGGGSPCDDGDPCSEDETCSSGFCRGTPIDCSFLDSPCVMGTCNTASGTCEAQPANDGQPCDDGIGCTEPDVCSNGTCAGADVCTNGSTCNQLSGQCELRQTLVFQTGVGGYDGTLDANLDQLRPDTNFGTVNYEGLPVFDWDVQQGGTADSRIYSLLEFEGLFGAGSEQIPSGAAIERAMLELTVTDNGGSAPNVFNVLTTWDEDTVTWNNFGSGPGRFPLAGVDYAVPAVAVSDDLGEGGAVPGAPYVLEIDVTFSLQQWSDGASNRGWIFEPVTALGVSIAASEYTDEPGARPRLTVEALCRVPGAAAIPFDADEDGDVDLDDYVDFESCLLGPGVLTTESCRNLHDHDGDGDVDVHDYAALQAAFSSSLLPLCN